MTNISSTAHHYTPSGKDNDPTELSFDDKVLHYIEQNKPKGSLSELMDQMRELSPDKTISMQQMNKALLYSDTYLRNTDDSRDYTDSVLDKFTIQLLGVNMLFNNMMYKSFTQSDDDTSL